MSTTSRRAVLIGAAALTAAPAAVLAGEIPTASDPIFAAIEGYNRSVQTRNNSSTRAQLLYKNGEINNEELDRFYDNGLDIENQAFDELLQTVPTTPSGAVALASFLLIELDRKGNGSFAASSMDGGAEDGRRLLRNVVTALQPLASAASQ